MNKSISITICVILLFVFFSNNIYANASNLVSGKIVVIDPGHGGTYPGAVQNNVREADVNLAVSVKLSDKLTAAGIHVVMTRNSDTNVAPKDVPLSGDLQARVNVATNHNADIFVSLHANSDPDSPITSGIISFYGTGRPNNLAAAIQHALVQEAKAKDGGVRPANFYVLRNSEIPATLVEMGFLTNTSEAMLLADASYQETIAEGIYKGIIQYFLSNNRTTALTN